MRLFVAVGIDAEAKNAVMADCQRLRKIAVGGHFTTADNLHLTLAFLGDVDLMIRTRIDQALATVEFVPFPMTIAGLGRFPSGNRSILYFSVNGGEALPALTRAIRTVLREAGVSFDDKAFVAHLTIARETVITDADIVVAGNGPAITTFVRSFVLMESCREGGNLVYRNRHEFPATTAPE
ncbi:MAG: RNA 2',3'-cyclic phosphodiesterase [bacterium]